MEWTNERNLEFIKDYKKQEILWNTRNPNYNNHSKKRGALAVLADKYSLGIKDLKGKIKTLRSSFHREHRKMTRKSFESSEGDSMKKWYAYEALNFLLTLETRKKNPKEKVVEQEHEDVETFQESFDSEQDEEERVHGTNTKITNTKIAVVQRSATKRKRTQEEKSEECVETNKTCREKDEFSVFGEYVANEIRKLRPRAQIIAKHEINNVLFEVAMEHHDNIPYRTTSSSQTTSTAFEVQNQISERDEKDESLLDAY